MYFLTRDYQRSTIKTPPPLLKGLDAWLHSFVGTYMRTGHDIVRTYLQEAEAIDSRQTYWHNLSQETLHKHLMHLKESFRRRERGYRLRLPDALGAIREAALRTLGLKPYVVQLTGALTLYNGHVAEMATGEGKTLTAAMAGILYGWSGLPCHIITVNDYLAERDKKWMNPLYRFCGVTAGHVGSEMEPAERREGYHNDVVYTTSKEIVADFLRDRLWLGTLQKTGRRQIAWFLGRQRNIEQGLVMRGLHSAIVDEADSILIDEAVTPLIISKATSNESFIEACRLAYAIADGLVRGKDYKVDIKFRDIEFIKDISGLIAEKVKDSGCAFKSTSGYNELVHQALIAKEFFHRNKEYIIQEEQVVIVDEFTGRQMPQRKWRAGIHQFVEAKEDLPVTSPTETLARLSFQRFFRFFHNLAGMTGTARESAHELWDIYELTVATVPENKPCIRKEYPVEVFPDQESKWRAIVHEISEMHKLGRPVLIGTRSVKASEALAERLEKEKLTYQLLNAKNHKKESMIVAQAGEPGTITIATNMAGRGTDIRLGKGVAERGGLHVIASECHESKRIDRQLFGRCARQGDPGSSRLFVSMEDELVERYAPRSLRELIKWQVGNAIPGSRFAGKQAIQWAQWTAQSIAYKRRRSVLNMDTWLDDSLSFALKDIQ
ncbi:MAG: hypothetical protein JW881_04780 [Spirochaetales bacterium]|nr:hypothetical protein [Spirochaetales bacterium]